MWFDLFMIACGLIVITGVGLWLWWWFVDDLSWLPLVGPDWRAERHDRLQLERTRREVHAAMADSDDGHCMCWSSSPDGDGRCRRCGLPDVRLPDPDDADEDWADELHAINQELHGNVITGQFGDLSRPMEQLTHYEVEAVIAQLGHADWLPAAA